MNRPARILVDLDGVLADFDRAFVGAWTERYPTRPLPDPAAQTSPKIIHSLPQGWRSDARDLIRTPGFYRTLPAIDGAIDGLLELAAIYSDVWICSSPLREWNPCVPEKYAWVEEQLGPSWSQRVILVRDKSLVRADVLIDDLPDLPFLERAVWTLVLHDRPYNQDAPGVARMTWATWKDVLQAVLGRQP